MLSEPQVHALQLMLAARAGDLFAELGLRMRRTGKSWSGPCPVHGGSGQTACNVWVTGGRPHWKCYSRFCHEEKGRQKSLLGFVRAVLSANRGGDVGYAGTLGWCMRFLGVGPEGLNADHDMLEREEFANGALLLAGPEKKAKGPSRAEVEKRLACPSPYFLSRGFSEKTVREFGAGDCTTKGSQFEGRAVVPVYEDGVAVGFTGRSVHEKCGECGDYHPPGPCVEWPKWVHQHGWRKESHLYGWERARPHILETGVCHLVEGPGCVWRLHEAGIRTGLGMFGASLSDRQQVLLEGSGASTVYVLTDDDDAGLAGKADIARKLKRLFKVRPIELPANDVGAMGAEEVKELLGGE